MLFLFIAGKKNKTRKFEIPHLANKIKKSLAEVKEKTTYYYKQYLIK